ncbi:MAG: hydrolase [Waddliaceae bacterium]|nr:hydrolase [Waddliaceae bacterium]
MASCDDASHDLSHFKRVVHTALFFARSEEGADPLVILAAAFLHDIVSLPKNHPQAKESSRLAAEKGGEILLRIGFPKEKISSVEHAIHAHSFSAKVKAETIEAKCVQDADRLEALGALGLIRTFYVSGMMNGQICHQEDPMAQKRELNDRQYSLDHFALKLLNLKDTMQTEGGRKLAYERSAYLEEFRGYILSELENKPGEALAIAEKCREAALCGRSLFHPEDPFAKRRPRQADLYLIDELLMDEEKFGKVSREFFAELKKELDLKENLIS